MGITQKKLQSLNSIDDVLALLSEELNWPVDIERIEKSTYTYTSKELGVSEFVAEKLKSIRQLKPASPGQPWGIFLVDLSGTTLSKRAIKEVLASLTLKRRTSKSPGLWAKEDLLFLVASGDGDKFQIYFLAFKPDTYTKYEMFSLDWRPAHLTPQYVNRLSQELLPKLKWPSNTSDSDNWRSAWSEAFVLKPGQRMKDANTLVKRMAKVALHLRESIDSGLKSENSNGPLHKLMESIKKELVEDVSYETFSDMCAQTITYGLLAARIEEPSSFGASPQLGSLPLNNLFLEELFSDVQEAIVGISSEDESLEALYADLRETDVESILDNFGTSADGGDPVVHFYEDFLREYDNVKRLDVGAVYTPKPIVDCMVRLVDEILVRDFDLKNGLADSSTWKELYDRLALNLPSYVDPDKKFVSILDPATGTGTYLISLISRIQKILQSQGLTGPDLDAAIQQEVANKIKAFELMLGPYAIANIKLALALSHKEIAVQQKIVYLTNSLLLGNFTDDLFSQGEESAISREGVEANSLKIDEPFTVIIGNPPYKREAKRTGELNKINFGGVIRNGYPPIWGSKSPLDDFVDDLPPDLKNKKSNLQDLYVYFWRWGIWQVLEKFKAPNSFDKNQKPGVVAYITGASFIKEISFGGMRSYMRRAFDEILVVDLGGDSRAGVDDPNVFGIQNPVCICIGIKSVIPRTSNECDVKYLRITGSRKDKLERLSTLELGELVTVDSTHTDPFIPLDESPLGSLPYLNELFVENRTGCLPGRAWVTSPSRNVLRSRWQNLMKAGPESKDDLFRVATNRSSNSRPLGYKTGKPMDSISTLAPNTSCPEIIQYSYRPFDNQNLIRDARLIGQASQYILEDRDGQFFMASGGSLSGGPSVVAFPFIPDKHAFNGRGGKDFFARFTKDAEISNLSASAIEYSKRMTDDNPEDTMLGYIYGIHGTGAYFESLRLFLGMGLDRAKLPLTGQKDLFSSISNIGMSLLNQHLGNEMFKSKVNIPRFEASPQPIKHAPSQIRFDRSANALYFDNIFFSEVPKEIWDFSSNGLRVVQDWIKNRTRNPKGKRSSPLDEINETKWIYNEEFKKMIADVSAVIEAKKLVMPLMEQLVEELKNQPGK